MRIHTKKGFTLIELLVVVAIIGMLSSVVLASLNTARSSARDAQRGQGIKQLATALELYYNDNNTYPQYLSAGTGRDVTGLSTYLVPSYIAAIPTDSQGQVNQYVWGTNQYGLYVYTEKVAGWCRTGVNINTGWWGSPPTCPF